MSNREKRNYGMIPIILHIMQSIFIQLCPQNHQPYNHLSQLTRSIIGGIDSNRTRSNQPEMAKFDGGEKPIQIVKMWQYLSNSIDSN